jgi:hypothetical protein
MFSWGQTIRDNLAADNGCNAPRPPFSGTVDMAARGPHMCYLYDGCSAGHPGTRSCEQSRRPRLRFGPARCAIGMRTRSGRRPLWFGVPGDRLAEHLRRQDYRIRRLDGRHRDEPERLQLGNPFSRFGLGP